MGHVSIERKNINIFLKPLLIRYGFEKYTPYENKITPICFKNDDFVINIYKVNNYDCWEYNMIRKIRTEGSKSISLETISKTIFLDTFMEEFNKATIHYRRKYLIDKIL